VNFRKHLAILGPLILTSDLLLFLGGEIVRDVERLSDLLGGLALDHVGDSLASDVKKRLDVEIVGGLWEDVSFVLLNVEQRWLTKMISKSISWSTCINF
jgi:hypothetical protein